MASAPDVDVDSEIFEALENEIGSEIILNFKIFDQDVSCTQKQPSPEDARLIFTTEIAKIVEIMNNIRPIINTSTKLKDIFDALSVFITVKTFKTSLDSLLSDQFMDGAANVKQKTVHLRIAPIVMSLYSKIADICKVGSEVRGMRLLLKTVTSENFKNNEHLATYRKEFNDFDKSFTSFITRIFKALDGEKAKYLAWRSSPSYKSRRQLGGAQPRLALVAKAPWKCNLCNAPKCKHCLHCQFGKCDKRENGFTHSE